MRSWTIAFSLGIILCGFVPQLPAFTVVCALQLLSVLLHCWRRLRLAGAFLAGACWLLFYALLAINARWPNAIENVDVWVQGTIWSVPQPTARGQRFELMIDRLCGRADLAACDFDALQQQHTKVLLNVYQAMPLAPGQRWQLKVRVRKPHGFANPGGFDYEAWLMQQDIRGTGYVREDNNNRLLAENGGQRRFNRLRALLMARLTEAAQGRLRYVHLVRALTLGDRYGISEEEWALFSATGTNHLIVISGLHIGLIAMALYRLGWWLVTRFPFLLRRVPAPQQAAVAGLFGAWFYTGLAGFALPAQRSLVMAAVFLSGRLLQRQTAPVNALCLALALVLLFDPMAPQNAGFWLSFCAVAVLLLTVDSTSVVAIESNLPPADTAVPKPVWLSAWHVMRTQLLVFAGLLPVMLIFFQQVSPAAPLINIPAIPYIGLIVVPLSLVALLVVCVWPPAGEVLLQIVDYLLHSYMLVLEWWVRHVPVDLIVLPALSPIALVLLCAAILLLLFARPRVLRLAAVLLIPMLFLIPEPALPPGTLRITVLDVGQGLAAVVSTRNHQLLYDAGPRFSARFDAGSDVVVPFLRHRNIRRLDTVIISHADTDHAGGLEGVAVEFPDASYLGSDQSIFPDTINHEACAAGQRWHWDGIDFAMLHPAGAGFSRNNGSCVLEIRAGQHVILLPGDIERPVENRLLLARLLGKTTLLIAPHHGSRTSSSPPFVANVAPDVVVYTSGYLNRFNHPLPDVQARYALVGSRQLLTSVSGALTFRISAAGIESVEAQRNARRRFWSWPPPE